MPNGLPNVAGNILGQISQVQADVSAVLSLLGLGNNPAYGIYSPSSGSEVLQGYNSVIGFGFSADEHVPVYPIEQGGFQSYNKVALPFGAKLQYTVYQDQLEDFIAVLEGLRTDTNLYAVVTPVYSWMNCNVNHWDTRLQNSKAVSMWIIDVWLSEIRQQQTSLGTGNSASPTATATPDTQAQTNGGWAQGINGNTGALGANNAAYAQIMGETAAPPPVGAGG